MQVAVLVVTQPNVPFPVDVIVFGDHNLVDDYKKMLEEQYPDNKVHVFYRNIL